MKQITFWSAAALCAVASPLAAQRAPAAEDLARNTISFELMGPGGAYSIGYERLFRPTFGVRVGFAYYDFEGGTVTVDGADAYSPDNALNLTLLPVTASWLRGETHHLEMGGGPALGYAKLNVVDVGSGSDVLWYLSGLLGYRYQRPHGGIFFRAAYTPVWSEGELSPVWFGLGIGYTY